MPPEIVALIDKPWLLAAVIAVGAVCGMAVERLAESQKRAVRRAWWQGRNGGKGRGKLVGFRRDKQAIPLKGTPERAILDDMMQSLLKILVSFLTTT